MNLYDWVLDNLSELGKVYSYTGLLLVFIGALVKLYTGEFATGDTVFVVGFAAALAGVILLFAEEIFYLHDKLEEIENAD
mgnify:CR=1 FL=1